MVERAGNGVCVLSRGLSRGRLEAYPGAVLLVTQSLDRVDAGGAVGRKVARKERHGDQRRGDYREGHGVRRADL